jgi:hypothetical protein
MTGHDNATTHLYYVLRTLVSDYILDRDPEPDPRDDEFWTVQEDLYAAYMVQCDARLPRELPERVA